MSNSKGGVQHKIVKTHAHSWSRWNVSLLMIEPEQWKTVELLKIMLT